MLPDNTLMLIIAGIFALLALVVTFYIGVEVVRLLREFFGRIRDGSGRWASNAESAQQGQRPGMGFEGGRKITPYRDRDTVERLIDHFEEDEMPDEEFVAMDEEMPSEE